MAAKVVGDATYVREQQYGSDRNLRHRHSLHQSWLGAATNGQRHLRELDRLIARFVGADDGLSSLPFSLESGNDQLRKFFGAVDLRRPPPPQRLDVTDVEPLVDYIRSVPAGAHLDAVKAQRVRQFVGRRIVSEGCFRINTDAGVFIASLPRAE